MMAMNDFHRTVSEIVRADYRTADVFKKYGINYCCSGQVPLEEACALKNLELEVVVNELEEATRNISLSNSLQFVDWKIDFLIDYIVNVHHAYIYLTLPSLQAGLESFAEGHKKQYPELVGLTDVFMALYPLILAHCRHEEEIIFPYIKQIDNAFRRKESYGSLFVRTLRKPFHSIEGEHRRISDLLQEIRALTKNYIYPENACTNHTVIYQKLNELDQDMVQHKHLENNILFPKVVEMERLLLQL
jgi:regulator of cell morphogenesis and NO signaling